MASVLIEMMSLTAAAFVLAVGAASNENDVCQARAGARETGRRTV